MVIPAGLATRAWVKSPERPRLTAWAGASPRPPATVPQPERYAVVRATAGGAEPEPERQQQTQRRDTDEERSRRSAASSANRFFRRPLRHDGQLGEGGGGVSDLRDPARQECDAGEHLRPPRSGRFAVPAVQARRLKLVEGSGIAQSSMEVWTSLFRFRARSASARTHCDLTAGSDQSTTTAFAARTSLSMDCAKVWCGKSLLSHQTS